MISRIKLINPKKWLLIVGLIFISMPRLLNKTITFNSDISDFITGIGASFVLASLYFFYRNKKNKVSRKI